MQLLIFQDQCVNGLGISSGDQGAGKEDGRRDSAECGGITAIAPPPPV